MDTADKRLFIFDDDATLTALIRRVALKNYPRIFTAASYTRALELVRDEVGPFDLIMTDLNFPDGNGLDILRAAKNKSPLTSVAIFTGFASLETAIQALNEGAFDYITKPFTLEQILALLNKMEAAVTLQRENIELHRKLESSASHMERQLSRYDALHEQIQDIRNTQAEHSTALARILDTLEGLIREKSLK